MTARFRPLTPPPPHEKVGKKIDVIAKSLAITLEDRWLAQNGLNDSILAPAGGSA